MKNYFLTYDDGEIDTYAWFETEEELMDFVKEGVHKVHDAIEVYSFREITVTSNEGELG